MGQENYRNGFDLTLQPHMLDRPLHWREPRRIFVDSMSDLFHDQVPDYYIDRAFDTMRDAHWHQFQILTKRSWRLIARPYAWQPNIWMGVSVESPEYVGRIERLRQTGAAVKFVSIEPLLERMPGLDLAGIDWVIVGGESGPESRPMQADWVREIRDQCADAGVAFFFKQWGGVNKGKTGRTLDGETYDGMPELVEIAGAAR
jgi:protein gp37